MPKRTYSSAGMTHVTVFLCASALIFGLLAHYQYTIAQNDERALIVAVIAVMQWLVALSQPDTRQYLKATGHIIGDPEGFGWSKGRRWAVTVGLLWLVLIFWLSWDAVFDRELVICWITGMIYWWFQLSESGQRRLHIPTVAIPINIEFLLFVAIMLVGAFSLYYRLETAPAGMTADHAEKIFDLVRIDQGSYPVYFGANSGREPIHFYASYGAAQLLDYSFLSLKHVSALTALLVLPALYYLGRQVDGQLTGLLAMALGAVSVWHMIMGRSGFRAYTAALAAAILLGILWQALHSGKRRDFLLTGLVLGFGQYGYTAFRIAPLLIVAGFGLHWIASNRGQQRRLMLNLAALLGMAAVAYVPMFAYWLRYPHIYWYRSQQMVGNGWAENIRLYVEGLLQSFGLFNFVTDPVAINIIPGWGTLGPVVGALWLMGLAVWLWRVIQNRKPLDALLLFALFIFVLPSAMAISAPNEMPSARRAVTAFPVVMSIGAIGLAFVLRLLYTLRPYWILRPLAILLCGAVLYVHTSLNWEAYFNEFTPLNNFSANGQFEVANQIRHFERMGGSRWDAYLLYSADSIWVDPRIVAIWLGEPLIWENVLVDDGGSDVCGVGRRSDGKPIMYIVSLYSDDLLRRLSLCFPRHTMFTYHDQVGGEMFNVFIVPGDQNNE